MDNLFTRREIIKGVGATTLGLSLTNFTSSAFAQSKHDSSADDTPIEYTLPPLPYAYDALEPHIDKETLMIHHDKHHAGYVKKLNAALQKLSVARKSSDYSLIKHLSRDLAFNGSGHILHSLYWQSMSPKGERKPKGELLAAIIKDFGSLKNFNDQFQSATKAVEGSGWGILCFEPLGNRLIILQAEKHQNLSIWNVYPLLVCDVWEHAYYLKYQNRRGEYIKNFMKIINWSTAENRYIEAKKL